MTFTPNRRMAVNISPLLNPKNPRPEHGCDQKAAASYLHEVRQKNLTTLGMKEIQAVAALCTYITAPENAPFVLVSAPGYTKWPEIVDNSNILLDKIAELARPVGVLQP